MGKTAFNASRGTVFNFDPEDLVLVEDPAHSLYQERVHLPVSEALVASIKAKGFRSTIRIRRNGELAEVVDGRQRVKAAREANRQLKAEGKQLVKVQAYLEHGGDADLMGVMVLANRGQQIDDPVAEAKELQKLLSFGVSPEEAAKVFFKPVSWVKQAQSLLDLAPAVQQAVTEEKISVSAASKLAKFTREEQPKRLGFLLEAVKAGKKATVEQVKRAVRNDSGEKHVAPPSKKEIKEALVTWRRELGNGSFLGPGDALEWVMTGSGIFGDWLARNHLPRVVKKAVA